MMRVESVSIARAINWFMIFISSAVCGWGRGSSILVFGFGRSSQGSCKSIFFSKLRTESRYSANFCWSCLPNSRFTAFALSRTESRMLPCRFRRSRSCFIASGVSSRNSLRYMAVTSIEGTCTPVRVKLVWLLSFTFSVIDG